MEVTIIARFIETPNSSPVCCTWIALIPIPQFAHWINQTIFDVYQCFDYIYIPKSKSKSIIEAKAPNSIFNQFWSQNQIMLEIIQTRQNQLNTLRINFASSKNKTKHETYSTRIFYVSATSVEPHLTMFLNNTNGCCENHGQDDKLLFTFSTLAKKF